MSVYALSNGGLTRHESQPSLNPEQATSLIIERARQLVHQLVEHKGNDEPPFLPEKLAYLQGIKQIVKAELGEKTGAILLKLHDGYVIKVNQNHHPVRQNFSCAHEIGHILFNELKLEQYIRNIEYRTFNPEGERNARSRTRERLCDAAATELLMPEFVFRKYLTDFGVSVHSIERLASIFKVSIHAAAIRIAEISIEPCIALLWQPLIRDKPKTLRLSWCVGPGRKFWGKANYMPIHPIANDKSTLYKAYQYQYDTPVKSSKDFKCDNVVKRLPIESKGFGRNETRYVISLAFLDR